MTEEQQKEAARSILATQHQLWQQNAVTKHLVEILDGKIAKFESWLSDKSVAATEVEVRSFLAQLREQKQVRKLLVETTTFVKEVIK